MGFAFGLLATLMVFTGTSLEDIWSTIRMLPLKVYLLALACHMTLYMLRALRFWLLIPSSARPDYGRVLVVSSAHNLASYVLPAKTGEASFVIYLRRFCGVRSAQGLAALVVARLLDAAVLCLGLSTACLVLGLSGKFPHLEWLGGTGALLVAVGLVLALLSTRGDWLVRGPKRIVELLGLGKRPLGQKVLEMAEQVAIALRSAGSGGRLVASAVLTIPIWILVFSFYAILGPAMGLEGVGFFEATFGASLAMMSNLLPINGMAGFGTQETGWVLGFGLLGVPRDVAIRSGLGVHLVQLFNVCAMGLVAHLAMGMMTSLDLAEPIGAEGPDAEDPKPGDAPESGPETEPHR